MRTIKGDSFASVYMKSLHDLVYFPEHIAAPRDMKIKEITNLALVVKNPKLCLYQNKRRGSQFKYVSAEILWYFAGRNDLSFIEKYATFWRQIANPDNTLNSAYGNLIFNQRNEHGLSQWQWAMNSLIKDKDSRQAVMLFNKPQYQYSENKDFICTLNAIFNIRKNKLNLTINMRSNDAILGAPTDISFFCLLLQQAHRLLKKYYPELELGSYTHIGNSYHLYERHFELVNSMINEEFIPISFPELDIDLIDINGAPSPQLIKLMNVIEFNEDNFDSDSKFLNWIYEQLKN